MLPSEYFLAAINARAYTHKTWIISVFTVCHPPVYLGRKPDYPYQIFKRSTESMDRCFVDPNDPKRIVDIECDPQQPIVAVRGRISLHPGDLVNVTTEIDTTYGNVLLNAVCLIYTFGNRFPFMAGKFKATKIEDMVAALLTDTPPPGAPRDPKLVYVDEYKKFARAMSSLGGIAQINVPSASPKSLTINPAILKRRDELLAQYKDTLTDPATLAKIEMELVNMDIEDLKGDPAEGFYIKHKSYAVTRKKAFVMIGADAGFTTSTENHIPIVTSLRDGWDTNNLPAMADTIRNGSYGRGLDTAKGGESVKYFYRIFQNTKVAEDDCNSELGVDWYITPDNWYLIVGLWPLTRNPNAVPYTTATAKEMIGHTVSVRSPMYCHTTAPSFCAKCVGTQLAANPTGVHIAASDVGTAFMLSSMSAMHGVALTTKLVNVDAAFT